VRVDVVELDEDPLIRLYATQQQAFATLHREVKRLASGTLPFCRLHEHAAFEMSGDLYLVLMAGEDRGAHRLDDQKFSWELTPARWSLVAGLIEPFAHNPREGTFQWLAGPDASYGLNIGDTAVLLSCSAQGRW